MPKCVSSSLCLLLVIAVLFLISGCGALFYKNVDKFSQYESGVSLTSKFNQSYKIFVHVNTGNLGNQFNKKEIITQIKNSIIYDIEENIFMVPQSLENYKIIVNVNVKELEYKGKPWGLLWFPFVYVGAPLVKLFGTTDIQITMTNNDGHVIGEYGSKKEITKWVALYWGFKYWIDTGKGGISKAALKQAMDDIKQQIQKDQSHVIAKIEELDDRDKPKIISGQRKISFSDGTKLAVAVIDLESQNVPKGELSIITDLFREALWKSDKFEVLERNQMDDIMEEQGFQLTGCTDTKCAAQLGVALNVEEMIVGSFEKLGDLYIIAIRFVNVESIKVTLAESVRCKCTIEEIPQAIEDLTKTIISYFE